MRTRVVSLNAGGPEAMEWNGQSVVSSMHKKPIQGAMTVSMSGVLGDKFANGKHHGLPHSALYAFGLSSIRDFISRIGLESYEPGALGENLTVENLDEAAVSAGDIFTVGTVTLEATFPRIPCGKVNFRMRHPEGQRQMLACGRSGIYFRVLAAGEIPPGAELVRIKTADTRVSIAELYERTACGRGWKEQERIREVLLNKALPESFLADLQKKLA